VGSDTEGDDMRSSGFGFLTDEKAERSGGRVEREGRDRRMSIRRSSGAVAREIWHQQMIVW
jgi:hypothetical protein